MPQILANSGDGGTNRNTQYIRIQRHAHTTFPAKSIWVGDPAVRSQSLDRATRLARLHCSYTTEISPKLLHIDMKAGIKARTFSPSRWLELPKDPQINLGAGIRPLRHNVMDC